MPTWVIVVAALIIVAVVVVIVVVNSQNSAPASARPSSTTFSIGSSDLAGTTTPGSTGPASTAPDTTVLSPVSSPVVLTPTSVSATCQSPNGVDASNLPTSYEPQRAVDGDPTTSWRCDGDATNQSIELSFGTPVHLSSVGIIPGFAKIDAVDGADRFQQNRKIVRVRYQFDGSSLEVSVPASRSLESTPVNVVTTRVSVVILQTSPGTSVVNQRGALLGPIDKSPISEISVMGQP